MDTRFLPSPRRKTSPSRKPAARLSRPRILAASVATVLASQSLLLLFPGRAIGQSLTIDSGPPYGDSPYTVDGTALHPGGTYVSVDIGRTNGGELDLSGGSITTSTLFVGDYASGLFNQTGGTLTLSFAAVVGSSASGTLLVSGGVFDVTGQSLAVGLANTGTVTVSGTGLLETNALYLSSGNFGSSSNATFNLDGGTLQTAVITYENSTGTGNTSTFNFNGGLLRATGSGNLMYGLTTAQVRNGGAIIDSNGNNITISQALVHSTIGGDNAIDGGLTKQGSGTLTLTGANTYTGGTTITGVGSTLQVGSGALPGSLGTGAVSVGNGGTLNLVNVSGNVFANNIANGFGGSLGLVNFSPSLGVTITLSGAITSGAEGILLTQSGAGTTILTNSGNTFSGFPTSGTQVYVSSGTLQIGTAANASTAGANVAGGNNNLTVGTGGILSLVNVSGGILENSVTNGSGGAGTLNANSATALTLAGPLLNTLNQLALTQTGAGTTTLTNGSNALTSATVSAGGLTIGTSGSPSRIDAAGTAPVAVGNGGTLTLVNLVGNAMANNITNSLGYYGAVNSNPALGVTTTLSGAITSGLGGIILTQAGAGTTILTNSGNTFSGSPASSTQVYVTNGTLQIGTAANASTAGANVPGGTTNGISVGTGGILSLVNVSGGTLNNSVFNSVGGIGTLNANSATALTLAGILASTQNQLALTQTGAGTTTLTNGSNSLTSATVSAGGLTIGTSGSASRIDAAGTAPVSVGAGGTLTLVNLVGNAMANNIGNTLGGAGSVVVNSANTNTLSGILSNAAGTLALMQSGTGKTILTGANTYTGGTTINAGTLSIGADNGLGDVSGGLTFNGGTLETTATFSTQRNVTMNSGGGTFSPDGNTALMVSSVIGGSGGLTLSGAGTLVLTAQNTFTGGATVTAGTLQLGDGTNAATLVGLNQPTVANTNGGVGGTAATVNGTGLLQIMLNSSVTGGSGASTSFGFNGGGGGVGVNVTGAGSLLNAGSITGGSGAAAFVGGQGGMGVSFSGSGSFLNTGSISAGLSGSTSNRNGTNGATGVSFSGSGSFVNAGSIRGADAGGTSSGGSEGGAGGTGVIFSGTGLAMNTVTGSITGGNGTPGNAAPAGNGGTGLMVNNATFLNAGSISGGMGANNTQSAGNGGTGVSFTTAGTLINSGIISAGAYGTGLINGSPGVGVTFSGAGGSLINLSGGAIHGGVSMGNFANNVTLQAGSVIDAGSVSGDSGNLNIGTSTTSTLTLTDNGTGGTQNYSSAVTGTTTFNGTLIKNGTGIWVIDSSLSNAGAVTVNAGTLQLGNGSIGSPLGATTPIAVASGATLALDFANSSTFANNVSNSGTINLVSPNPNPSAYISTLSGVISGTGGITQVTNSVTYLSGANTYTGATILDWGTVIAQVATNAGNTSGAFGVNSAVTVNALNNGADLFLNGYSNTIGTLSGNAGGVISNNGGGSAATLTIGSGVTSSAVTTTYSGSINDGNAMHALSLTKIGAGTQILAGASSYSGSTTVDAGTLQLAFSAAHTTQILSNETALVLGGGTFSLAGTGSSALPYAQTLNGLTTAANTASQIILTGGYEVLHLGGLSSAGTNSALNFNTAAGGANGSTLGTSLITLGNTTTGVAINPNFTVTDAGGFGLATVNGSGDVIRLATTALLPASGAASSTDYLVNNNSGGASAPGSSTLAITANETANSITVDTTAASGVLTLNSGVVLGTNTWNFGGLGTNPYTITGSASGAGLTSATAGGTINFNNYNTGAVTISAPILDNSQTAVNVGGTGTLILTGMNTFTGGTTVNSGTLQLGDGTDAATLTGFTGALGSVSGVVVTINSTANFSILANASVTGGNGGIGFPGIAGTANNYVGNGGSGGSGATGVNFNSGGAFSNAGSVTGGMGGTGGNGGSGANGGGMGPLSSVNGGDGGTGGDAGASGNGVNFTGGGTFSNTGQISGGNGGLAGSGGNAGDGANGTVTHAAGGAGGNGGNGDRGSAGGNGVSFSGSGIFSNAGTISGGGGGSAGKAGDGGFGGNGTSVLYVGGGGPGGNGGNGGNGTAGGIGVSFSGGVLFSNAGTISGGTGGAGSSGGNGGLGGDGGNASGGGNGGNAGNGGNGGNAGNGAAGGAGVTFSDGVSFSNAGTIFGGNGGAAGNGGNGGTGGNGGIGSTGNGPGGSGGNGGVGGNGAVGGVGAAFITYSTFLNTGSVIGGNGSAGGNAGNGGVGGIGSSAGVNGNAGLGGTGGAGGNGATFSAGGLLVNGGTIQGGSGGTAGTGIAGSAGNPGIGVSFSGGAGNLVNLRGGSISGGVSMSSSYANTVTLQIGSTINGALNLGTNAASTLTLTDDGSGGTQSYTAAVTQGASLQGTLIKNGLGTWILDTLAPSVSLVTVNSGTLTANTPVNFLSTPSLLLGGGTLNFTGVGLTETLNTLSTTAATGSVFQIGFNASTLEQVVFAQGFGSIGAGSALNFNTALGGNNGSTIGSSYVTIAFVPPGTILGPNFTVTDAGGFGLAEVVNTHVIRVTNTSLLPASGASPGADYLVNLNSDTVTAGSLNLAVTASEAARSITVDTSAAAGTLTLNSGVMLGTSTWNFGGAPATTPNGFTIAFAANATSGGLQALSAGTSLNFNNYNAAPVTIAAPILDNGTTPVLFTGTGTTILTAANTYAGGTTISGNATLQIGNGAIGGSILGNVTDNGTLAFNPTGSVTFANPVSGTGGLVQSGAGTVILTGANNYSGPTTISAGTLQIGNGTTVGTIGTGNIFDNAALVINHSDTVTLGQVISGSGALTQNGSGTLVLTAQNTFTGGTTVNAGTLQVGDGTKIASLTGATGGNFDQDFGFTGGLAVTVNSAGTLVVSTNGTVTGGTGGPATNVGGNGGQGGDAIDLASGGSLINSGTITGGAGGNAYHTGGSGGTGVLFLGGGFLNNTGSISGGRSGVGNAFGAAGGNGVLIGGTGTFMNSGTISGGTGSDNADGDAPGGSGVSFTAPGSFTNSGTITGGNAGVTTSNYYGTSGGAGINFGAGGLLTNSGSIAGGLGTTGMFGSGVNGAGASFSGGAGTLSNLAGGTIGGGVVMDSGYANQVTLQAGSVITGGLNIGTNTGSTLTLTDGGSGATQLYSAAVTGGANATTFNGSLTKNGSGTWVLDQAFTYGGSTTINAGTLTVGIANALPSGTAVNLTTTGATFDLNGYNDTVASLTGAAGTLVNNGSATAGTLTVGDATPSTTFAGVIENTGSGRLSLVKQGSGALILSAVNTFTGGTTVNAGTLQLGDGTNPAALVGFSPPFIDSNQSPGGTAVIVNSGAMFQIFANATVTGGAGEAAGPRFDNLPIVGGAGGAAVVLNGSAVLTVNGGTLIGGTGGALAAGGKHAVAPGAGGPAVALSQNATLNINGGSLTGGTGGLSAGDPSDPGGVGGDGIDSSGSGTLTIQAGSVTGGIGGGLENQFSGTPGTGGIGISSSGGGPLVNHGSVVGGLGGGNQLNGGSEFYQNSTLFSLSGKGGAGLSLTASTSLTNTSVISGGAGGTASITNLTMVGSNDTFNATGGNGGAGVVFAAGGILTNSGTITGGAGGAAILSGDSNSSTVNFVASAGTGATAVVFTGGGTLLNSGAIVGGAAGVATVSGPGTGNNGTAGAGVVYSGGTGTLVNQTGGSITGGVIMDSGYANSVTLFNGSTITGGLNIGTNAGSTLTLTDNGSGGTQLYSKAVDTTTFSGSLVKNGAGTWVLDSALNYTGTTTVNAGTLQIGDGTGESTISGNSAVTVGAAGILAINLTNNSLFANNVSNAGTINLMSPNGNSLFLTGVISGAGGIVQETAMTTLLKAANTYTGPTILDAGAIIAGSNSAFGVNSAFTVGAASAGASVRLDGFSNTIGTLSGNASSAISNSGGAFAATLTIGSGVTSSATTTTFAGQISDGSGRPLSLTKVGAGTQILTGQSNYTGATSINSGTLELSFANNASAILGSGTTVTLGGGTLSLDDTGTQTFTTNLTTTANTGSAIVLGTGGGETLTFAGLNAGTGSAVNFNTATGGANASTSALGSDVIVLQGQTAGSAINSGFTVTDAGGFGLATVDGSNHVIRLTTTNLLPASGAVPSIDYLVNNNSSGPAAAGSSSLVVTASEGANSITVDTTATSGTLLLSSGVVLSTNTWNFGGNGTNAYFIAPANGASGTGLTSTTPGGTIHFNNYNTAPVTIGVPILDNGSATAVNVGGTGTLILSGVNAFTGGTTLTGGTLQVGDGTNAAALVAFTGAADDGTNDAGPGGTAVTVLNGSGVNVLAHASITGGNGGGPLNSGDNSGAGGNAITFISGGGVLTNSGTISGGNGGGQGNRSSGNSGAGGNGVAFNSGGGVLTNSGMIAGGNGGNDGNVGAGFGGAGGNGVTFSSGSGTLANSGMIAGGNGGITGEFSSGPSGAGGNGVTFNSGGSVLTNSGAISGGHGGDAAGSSLGGSGAGGNGVTFSVGGGVLTNDGTITAGNSGALGSDSSGNSGAGGNGVTFSSGVLTNSGTITAGNSGNLGDISPGSSGTGGNGVIFNSVNGVLTNSGTITAGNSGAMGSFVSGSSGTGGNGVTFSGGNGVLTNSGTITAGSSGDVGDQSSGSSGTGGNGVTFSGGGVLTNSGTITAGNSGNVGSNGIGGSGAGGNGVLFSNGGGVLINSGTITGGSSGTSPVSTGAEGAGVSFSGGAGNLVNLNGGSISGGVTMDGNYANTVTLQIGSSLVGGLNMGKNTGSTLILTDDGTGGSQTYDVGGATTFNGSLFKNGTGTWTLTQAFSYSGSTTINAGTLQFGVGSNAPLPPASPLVFNGGTLLATTGYFYGTMESIATGPNSGGAIVIAGDTLLFFSNLASIGANSSFNFNTAGTGNNGSQLGFGRIVLEGPTAGAVINPNFTVTDAGGFGLATVDAQGNVIRLTSGALLPASGATPVTDYAINNNSGGPTAAGSSSLIVTASEAADSVTVGTASAAGVLTLNSGVIFKTNTWNFGGNNANSYAIALAANATGAGLQSASAGGTIDFNNYNAAPVTIGAPILDNAGTAVNFLGTGTTVLTAANTYTGGTTISSNSTLQIGNNGTTGSIAGNVTDNGSLVFNRMDTPTFAGVISGSGSVTQAGSGTLTTTGANTYSGPTTVKAGTLLVANTSGSGTGSGQVTVLSGATLGGSGTISGAVLVSSGATILGGSVTTPGTLTLGSLTLSLGSTYAANLATGSGSELFINGNTSLNGAMLTVNALSSPNQSIYILLDSVGTLSGTFQLSGNLPAGYTLLYTPHEVELSRTASIGTPVTGTPSSASIITGGSTPFTFTLTNSGLAGGNNLVASIAAGTNTTGTVSGTVTVAGQTTSNPVSGLSFNGTTVGAGQKGTFSVTDNNATNSPQTGTVSVNVYDHATIGSFTGGALHIGEVHAGYTSAVGSTDSLSVINGSATDYRVNLKGSATSPGGFSLSSISGVAAGGTGTITATLAPGQAVGAFSQAITYTFGDDSTLSGANANLAQEAITVSGVVYSGKGVWNTNGNGNWSDFSKWTTNGGAPGLDANFQIGDTATFGSVATNAAPTVSLNGVSPSVSGVTFNNSTESYTIAQGTSGALILNNGASAATVLVSAGSHTISAPVQLRSPLQVTVTNSGDRLLISGGISESGGARSLTLTGAGTLTLSGANTYTGSTTITSGTLADGVANALPTGTALSVTGTLDLNGYNQQVASVTGTGTVTDSATAATFTVNNSTPDTFGGAITGNNLALTKTGTDTLTLTGTNTYAGGTTISAGTLQIGAGNSTGGIVGNVVDNAALTFNRKDSVTFAGAISGGGALTQSGAGTLILSNTNTYMGATSVTAGTLLVNGSLAAQSSVTVSSAATLGGTGTIAGSVSVLSGGHLNPGGASAPGTLTIGSLVLNSGAISTFRLAQTGVAGNGVNDLASVTGNLTVGGILDVTPLSGFGVGSYPLFTYQGTLTNNGFSTINGLTGYTATLTTTTAGEVDLLVSLGVAQYWDGVGAANDSIISGGKGSWNTTTLNWTNSTGTTNAKWQSGTAFFTGTGGVVTLTSVISAQSLVFNSTGYTIAGSSVLTLTGSKPTIGVPNSGTSATITAKLAGTTGLQVIGAGTLILDTAAESYTGGTAINNGSLQIGTTTVAGSIGAGTVAISTGGTLSLVNTTAATLANAITNGTAGIGTLNISSTKTLTLSGALTDGATGQLALTQNGKQITTLTNPANTNSGPTTISAGSLQIGTASVAGSLGAKSAVNVGTGGTLTLADVSGNNFANNITNNLGGAGLVSINTTTSLTLSGALSNGTPQTGTGLLALTKSGTGTATLAGNDSFTGATTVTAGTLQIGDGTTGNLTQTSGVTVSGSSTLITNLGTGSTLPANISLSTTSATLKTAQAGTNTLSGAITGTGVFDQNSKGRTILTNTETYTGATNVNAGTLQVDGTLAKGTGNGLPLPDPLASAASSPVTVNTGGTLGGSGTISGAITLKSGGTIEPGVGSIGTAGTTLHGSSLSWNGGSTLTLQLGATTSDELTLTGALTKGTAGTFTLDLLNAGITTQTEYTLAAFASTTFKATDFKLELPTGFTGSLFETGTSLELVNLTNTTRIESTPASGSSLTTGVSGFGAMGGGLGDVGPLTTTPEPGSAMLLAFGGAAILGWRRRRERRH